MHLPPLNRYSKLAVSLVTILLFAYILIWLWQRQPKAPQEESASPIAQNVQEESISQDKKVQDLTPLDSQVLTKDQVQFSGKYLPNLLVVIYGSNFQAIVKASDKGEFVKEIELAQGLNQITVAALAADLQTAEQKFLTFWVTGDDEGDTVFAGVVKSIFDTLITVATPNGDRHIRTGTQTVTDVPKEENQAAGALAVKNIRIGDFAIGLGDSTDHDTILAKTLTIIRENKPQNTKQFVAGKIITNVRQSLFSAKDNQDGKIIELTLAKNSQIAQGENQGKIADIARDKTALIFYHPDGDKKIVDLVYLIP